jgi:putative ABC transport system substrate-binding protein
LKAHVGVLYRLDDPAAPPVLDSLRSTGETMNVSVLPLAIRTRQDIVEAIQKAARTRTSALMNVPEPLFFNERKMIADLCIEHRLPASFGAAEFADAGTLMATVLTSRLCFAGVRLL